VCTTHPKWLPDSETYAYCCYLLEVEIRHRSTNCVFFSLIHSELHASAGVCSPAAAAAAAAATKALLSQRETLQQHLHYLNDSRVPAATKFPRKIAVAAVYQSIN